jgi:putative oxidoreductase
MWNYTWQPLLGRILLAVIFLVSGYGKIAGFAGTAAYMASKGLPMVPQLLYATIAVEILGAAMIVVGYQTRWAALALLGFTAIITPVFHDFWNLVGGEARLQQIMFMKNLAIIGGLLMVVSFGPGRWSLDAKK